MLPAGLAGVVEPVVQFNRDEPPLGSGGSSRGSDVSQNSLRQPKASQSLVSGSISISCVFAACMIRFLIVSTSSLSYFAALSLWLM